MSNVPNVAFTLDVAQCEVCQSNAIQLIRINIGFLIRCCGCGRVCTLPDTEGYAHVIIEELGAIDAVVINKRAKPQ